MRRYHHYKLSALWNGNMGSGTAGVRSYDRSHTVSIAGKPELHLTTDNAAVGDKAKLNPEDLLVSALASCHMLTYLYVCALEGVVITDYRDDATGTLLEQDGGGHFEDVTLNPVVTVAEQSMRECAIALHHKAHDLCYIANSVNFEVRCNPVCKVAGED